MKLVRQVKLFFQEGTSDKVYEIDLCESGDGYLVNFRYGRRGASLKDGTKTVFPVPLAEAEKVFQALEQEKRKKGYVAAGEAPIVTTGEARLSSSASSAFEKRKKSIIKLLKAAASGEEAEHWPLPRIIWRAGDLNLTEAVPHIIKVANESDPANIHSVVWAIGRCGTSDAVGFLQNLQQKQSIAVHTRELVTDALLKLSSPKEKEVMRTVLLATLSSSIRESIATTDAPRLEKTLRELLFELKTSSNEFLVNVYRLVRDDQKMKGVLLSILPQVPLVANNFYAVRRIFKAAEMLQDHDTYGVLAKHFESQPASYKTRHYMRAEEKKKLAFSTKTKDYLVGRIERELRKLGDAGSDAYTQLATAILLSFNETDAKEPNHISVYKYVYNQSTRRNELLETKTHFDAFWPYNSLNYILFKNSKRYKQVKRGWACVAPYLPGQKGPMDREEAFPSLWNHASTDVIRILGASRISIIIDFALKIWGANADFQKDVITEDIVRFLQSPFSAVQRLGLDIAMSRYDRSNPDFALLLALLNSPFDEARKQVEIWLIGAQREVAGNLDFMVALLQLERPEAHNWLRKFFANHSFDPQQAEILVAKIIASIVTAPVVTEADEKRIGLIGDSLTTLFNDVLKRINLSIIQDLFHHSSAEVHGLAGKILLAHNVRPEELPAGFLALMMQSPGASTRGIGISLLGRFPENMLLDKKDLLVSFCLSPLADVRSAVRPIIKKLATAYPDFGKELVDLFVPAIIMKETYEGVHDDIVALLSEELGDSLVAIPQDKALKLVASRFRAPQKLGVVLVKRQVKFSELTVPEVVKLANNVSEEIRHLAWAAFRADTAKVKYFVIDALKITDSEWDDTRLFAFDYFRENFTATDWTPELLILLCDSIRADVQDFGRELITKFFDPKDGTEYLLKLSQHPTTRVQEFATAYLVQFASGKADVINTLQPYFITLLSQVNKGKTAKKRVMQFLKTESLREEAIARMGVEIFARVSVSVAITERAECIAALRDIQQKYPSIKSPLKVKEYSDYVNN
ncbi:MAG TPA: WGR domain-containing protein [Cyclobacteriaceae bacterium]|nr:WGR domain-containing protein [Cyclobacteriaceae bacterium]